MEPSRVILGTLDVGTIHDNENWFYEKKIQNFFQFFSVFWTPFTHEKIFLHFWAKNNLLLYTPPCKYPDISEPVQGRVKDQSF